MLDKEIILHLTHCYFQYFENKEINALSAMFDDNIVLFDPFIKEIKGKNNVIQANINIFNSCQKIKFSSKQIFVDVYTNTAIGEVEFYCDKKIINVVDIIEYGMDQRICRITAYLDTNL